MPPASPALRRSSYSPGSACALASCRASAHERARSGPKTSSGPLGRESALIVWAVTSSSLVSLRDHRMWPGSIRRNRGLSRSIKRHQAQSRSIKRHQAQSRSIKRHLAQSRSIKRHQAARTKHSCAPRATAAREKPCDQLASADRPRPDARRCRLGRLAAPPGVLRRAVQRCT